MRSVPLLTAMLRNQKINLQNQNIMESLIKDGVKYLIHNFQLENEFEKIVLRQSKLLFGENSIVFEKQKIRTQPGMGAIPDALIINPTTNKWFVIEIELAIHNVYHHINTSNYEI